MRAGRGEEGVAPGQVALEAEQKVRSAELADPSVYDDAARRNKLLAYFQTAHDKLEELTARWEEAAAKLESAKLELEKNSN